MKKISIIIILIFLISILKSYSQETNSRFNEKYRPQFHFSPATQWTNDPNGLVYFDGEYHLFYQHYPDSVVWGPMHWGHAVSKDMVHWEHLPIALCPDSLGWIFSGSAVVDYDNTSGFGSKENPPMVAIYSYHNEIIREEGRKDFQTQGIAYSLDRGRTWTKYNGNPVLKNPGLVNYRDPKVIWYQPTNRWIMALAVGDHVRIYSSKDLKSWEFESVFGKDAGAHNGVWECPDLFPLTDTEGNEKWAMLVSIIPGGPNGGSATQYFIGDFDGKTYKSQDTVTRWLDFGRDNYAGVTFSDIPKEDGRRIYIGWMNSWQYAEQIPTSGWRGAMTIPRELKLVKSSDDYLLSSIPVSELDGLRKKKSRVKSKIISKETEIKKASELLLEIKLQYNLDEAKDFKLADLFGLICSNENDEKIVIGYDNLKKCFFIDRINGGWESPNNEFAKVHYAPFKSSGPFMNMHLFIDRSSVELFAEDGLIVITDQFFPAKPFTHVHLFSKNGKVTLNDGKIWDLKNIWRK